MTRLLSRGAKSVESRSSQGVYLTLRLCYWTLPIPVLVVPAAGQLLPWPSGPLRRQACGSGTPRTFVRLFTECSPS